MYAHLPSAPWISFEPKTPHPSSQGTDTAGIRWGASPNRPRRASAATPTSSPRTLTASSRSSSPRWTTTTTSAMATSTSATSASTSSSSTSSKSDAAPRSRPGSTRTRPSLYPPSTRRSTRKDTILKPLERRTKPHGWLEHPDVAPAEGARTKETIAATKFTPSEHAAQPHARPKPPPLAERTFATYPPGCGPYFGGPSWPTEAPSGMSHALRSAGYTANFCVIVAGLALAPCAYDLIRAAFTESSSDDHPIVAWCVSVVAVCGMGAVYWRSQRKPIARWMTRVAASVATPEKAPGDVIVAGVAFFVGLFALARGWIRQRRGAPDRAVQVQGLLHLRAAPPRSSCAWSTSGDRGPGPCSRRRSPHFSTPRRARRAWRS